MSWLPLPTRFIHWVVLQQVRIHEYTQLSTVTKGRHATIGFGNLVVALTAQFITQRLEVRQCDLIFRPVRGPLRVNDVVQ